MQGILKNVQVYSNEGFRAKDIFLSDGGFSFYDGAPLPRRVPIADGSRFHLFPGFTDVHVHLREPGFSYKETILSGTRAAARGGYTRVCAMPNLNPVPDTAERLKQELDLIAKDALIPVIPYGAITMGEKGETLADLDGMAPYVAGFSDDGRGVQNEDMMLSAMQAARRLGRPIAAHCEDNSLLNGGCIHQGLYAQKHGLPGICSESEWGQIARDIELVRQTGCAYHVCHISCKESVDIIRKAKRENVNITCETAPHYLTLDENSLQDDGRFKMNPPLRAKEDRLALIEGLKDGTIDIIATDHAPHAKEEKQGGLRQSLNGIVGLETAFPVLYTTLVKPGILPMSRLIDALTDAPRRRFFPNETEKNDYCLFDLNAEYAVNLDEFLSMGRATPFAGMSVFGRHMMTVVGGRAVLTSPEFDRLWEESK